MMDPKSETTKAVADQPDQGRRVLVDLAPETVEALEEIGASSESGKMSIVDALRVSIGTERYLRRARKKGARVYIKERDEYKELIFPD